MDEPVEELLRRGKAAVNTRRYPQALQLLSAVVQRDPGNEQGWLWLSEVVESESRRRYCLQRVLAINPNNPYVAAALERIAITPTTDDIATPPIHPEPEPVQHHHLRRRPSSMVEGDAVPQLVHTHARLAWTYIGLWCLLGALNLVVRFGGQLYSLPATTVLSRTLLSAACVGTLLALAWWSALRMLVAQTAHQPLGRVFAYQLTSSSIWPSAMALLAALAAGMLQAIQSDSSRAFFGLIYWGLLGLAGVLLAQSFLHHLLDHEDFNRTTARTVTIKTITVLGLVLLGAVLLGLQAVGRILGS